MKNIRQRTYQLAVENMIIKLLMDDITVPSTEASDDILHNHPYTELFVSLSGTIEVVTEGGRFHLAKGDALLVPAGILHRKAEHGPGGEWRAVSFSVEKRGGGSELLRLLTHLTEGVTPIRIPAEAGLGIDRVICDMTARPMRVTTLPVMRLLLLLSELAEAEHTKETGPAVEMLNDLTRDSRLDYIVYECFKQNIPAADAARQLYISERQLSRICQRRYGMSFGNMLRKQRMISASQLLASGNLTVEEIADRCGYLNKFSFHRAFKAYFGLTPAAYRKKAKEKTDS